MTTPDGRRLVIEFSGSFPPRAEPFDSQRDWDAWVAAAGAQLGHPVTAPDVPVPQPSAEAVSAVEHSARRTLAAPAASRVIEAAVFTAELGRPSIFNSWLLRGRWERFVLALNAYPHPESTAARWLVPAVRNFIAENRETPEELWHEWYKERERRFQLTLHPRSPRFLGRKPSPTLLDFYDDSLSPPVSRTALEDWGIRAHLLAIPRDLDLEADRWEKRISPLDRPRLNDLVSFLEGLMDSPIPRFVLDEAIAPLRRYLLREAATPDRILEERRLLEEALERLQRAFVARLAKKEPLSLTEDHLEEYEWLRREVSDCWRKTAPLNTEGKGSKRMEFLAGLVMQELSGRLPKGIEAEDIEDCPPRKVAAVLLAIRRGLGELHPQTIYEALAEVRKGKMALHPAPETFPRRGRPPKRRDFSPDIDDPD